MNQVNYPPLIELTCKEFSRNDIEIIQDKRDEIGAGFTGSVYKGRWRGMDVAIKKYSMPSLPDHLRFEFDPYCKTSHENIVTFYGVCTTPGKFSIITELLPMNLCAFIKNFPTNDRVTSRIKMNIATGIGKGLAYLHSMKIVHGHIKETNIFLDKNYCAKLGGMGLSKLKLEASSNGAGHGEGLSQTVRWRAPETLGRAYTKLKDVFESGRATDIYSFGVALWQMEARTKPYPTLSEPQVVRAVSSGEKLPIDKYWAYAPIITKCLNPEPMARPIAEEILKDLRIMDMTKIYLIFLKNTPEVCQNGAMRDIFPMIANYLEFLL